MRGTTKIAITLVLTIISSALYAQRYPERRFVRTGNNQFNNGNYVESEVAYRRALEKDSASMEASYNLAGALYKQERYGEAAQLYSQVAADSTLNPATAAQTLYNTGNSLFKERQLEQALEAYKQSLRLNPNDAEAKFNLAYTKKLLDQNKDDQNKDQNKDNKDNKDNKQDQDKQDQNKDQDKQDPNKDKQDQNKDKQDQKDQQQQQSGMNKQESDQMLEAVQQNEDKTREKMNEKKVKTVGRSGKNW